MDNIPWEQEGQDMDGDTDFGNGKSGAQWLDSQEHLVTVVGGEGHLRFLQRNRTTEPQGDWQV